MSWYVLQCRTGQEENIIRSCIRHISPHALETAFTFRCERLWRSDGTWKYMQKEMFPGYVFLESSRPGELSKELETYRSILRVMEEPGYLISVYEEEERYLRELCGEHHCLSMSYGYRDPENGASLITSGPLKGLNHRVVKYDWHRRFARLNVPVSGKNVIVFAGIAIDEEILRNETVIGEQDKRLFLVS